MNQEVSHMPRFISWTQANQGLSVLAPKIQYGKNKITPPLFLCTVSLCMHCSLSKWRKFREQAPAHVFQERQISSSLCWYLHSSSCFADRQIDANTTERSSLCQSCMKTRDAAQFPPLLDFNMKTKTAEGVAIGQGGVSQTYWISKQFSPPPRWLLTNQKGGLSSELQPPSSLLRSKPLKTRLQLQ